jgi:hypothetical protein
MYFRVLSIKPLRVYACLLFLISPVFTGNSFSNGIGPSSSNKKDKLIGHISEVDTLKPEVFRIFPLEYLDYDARYESISRTIKLIWTTAKERDNSHFEVERSINSISEWETIERIEGVGFSDNPVNYHVVDQGIPLAGGIVYYRLKQFFNTSTFFYSGIVSVKVPKISDSKNALRAFPNPTNGEVKLEILDREKFQGQEIRVRVINPIGEEGVYNSKDFNYISSKISSFLQRSTKGIYILEVNWGKDSERIKLIKN